VGLVLALALAAPVVSLQSDGAPPCDTAAFAHDLRPLRPELTIVALDGGQAPPTGVPNTWTARLEGVASGQPVLRVTGGPTPLLRPLSAESCGSVVEIAASIVDGLLDQLPREASASLASEIPLHPSLGIWLGGGVLQGPIPWVPSIALGLRLTLGDWEIAGASDLGTLATLPLSTIDEGVVGSYKALPFDFEIGGGYAPHLGPGNLMLDALIGSSVVRVWTQGSPLFGSGDRVTLEPFVGVAAGYTIDLPARFFVGARIEERWSPTQAHSSVEGETGGSDSVVTRTWTFTADLLAGWRAF
jgi:hypothetical protein